jgi:integrase
MGTSSDGPLLLADLFERMYRPRKLLGRSRSNVEQYHIQFRHFERFLGHAPTVADLTDDTLAAAMQWLFDGVDRRYKPRAAETVNKWRAHIVALWNFAAKIGKVERWPTIGDIPVPESVPLAWTAEELTAIIQACQAVPGWLGPIKASDWWVALHRWLLCGGERTSASLSLRWDWINMTRGIACVPGSVRKTRTALTYSLSPECVEALEKIRRPTRELVFPWPLCLCTFYHHYKKILRSAGLPEHKAGPQKMRRSFASHLEAAGGSATAALHHSSRGVTKKHYLDSRIIGAKEYWRQIPRVG